MTTLTSPPLEPLINRLFAEADVADAAAIAAIGDIAEDELDRLRSSRTEYRAVYGRLKDAPLAVSRETGQALYMLARGAKARTIVEFGTSFGLSTLFLAAALRDNGGGRLITTEFEASKIARARANLAEAALVDLVEFREGDALDTLRDGLPDSIDFVLLDGAKGLYSDVLALVEPRLRPGAFVVADDAHASPEYLGQVRSVARGWLSTPFGGDVEVSMRL